MADLPASTKTPKVANRGAITACVILAVIMQALDTTIANVALPYIQGSVSASSDQINWVLTSYIVAAAIMTPPSGFLANKFGRKRVLLTAIAGFVIASILCGVSQSLVQIVVFRLMQGLFGAALVPLSQGILLDIYDVEERGSAMALFGVSVMVGPVLGPVIGGWLTDNISWRWVFYINVPIGALAFAGISFFVLETKKDAAAKLDWLGFAALSVGIAALQIFLDRGEQLDWFSSGEIQIEAIITASAFYIFLVHTFTASRSFVNPRLFLDRNFAVSFIFIFIVGITYLASLALMTPYLQTLMGYPVMTAGLVMGPRGMGTMLCMFLVGRLIGQGRYALAADLGPRTDRLGDVCDDRLDARRFAVDDRQRRIRPGHGARLPVRAADDDGLFHASRHDARRGNRPLQPVPQYRIERRDLGGVGARHRKYPDQSRRDRRLCHAFQPRVQFARGEALAQSAEGGRTRRARRYDHSAIGDHRLYRRLQAADDPVARGDAARAAAAQARATRGRRS